MNRSLLLSLLALCLCSALVSLPACDSTEEAEEPWLSVQDAEEVSFTFDDTVEAACPEDALWSGTVTLSGTSQQTLLVAPRGYRSALSQSTDAFITELGGAAAVDGAMDLEATLTWENPLTGQLKTADLLIRMMDSSGPSYDVVAQQLDYEVCGLTDAPPAFLGGAQERDNHDDDDLVRFPRPTVVIGQAQEQLRELLTVEAH